MKRLLLLFALLPAAYAVYVVAGLPSRGEVKALARSNPGKTALMRQREREALRARRKPRHTQVLVPIDRVSRHLIHAVVASEDQRFFGHAGVDWDAVKESVEANRARWQLVRGGSTITQQLAKNLFFGTEKTPTRKLRELVVAYWLESELSKRRILELYLNVIEWGDGIYGAEAAARAYFGRPASDLDPAQAAALAAMIPNPRRINPRTNPARHARATSRVLWLMRGAGYLGQQAGGLGAEPPPPEPEEDEDEYAEDEVEATPAAVDETPPADVPVGAPSPAPSEIASPEPGETPAPPPPSPSPSPGASAG